MTRARNDTVDAWRALLILSVLFFHYLIRWTPPQHSPDIYHYDSTYSPLWELGALGPRVFFVISGLVITMTLLRSRDVWEFFFRRFSRLYPAAIVASTLIFLVAWKAGPEAFHHPFKDLILSYTLAAPTLGAHFVDGAYWSLLVEVKFYFFVGLTYLFLKKRFWIGIAGIAIAGLALSYIDAHRAEAFLIAPHMSFFLAGMAAWYWIFEHRARLALSLAGVAIITFPAAFDSFPLYGSPSPVVAAIAVGITLVMIMTVARQLPIPLGPLPYLGRISYSLYLLHQTIGVTLISILKQKAHWPDLAAVAAATILSIALAALIYHLVEMPAQAGLRKFYQARRPHLLPVPEATV